MLKVTRHIASQGYDRIRCWANPVALPYGNEVLVLAQKLTLKAIDCFSDVSLFRSNDSVRRMGRRLSKLRRFLFYYYIVYPLLQPPE